MRQRSRKACRPRVRALAAGILLLASCSRLPDEPGLFGREPASDSPSPASTPVPQADPDLPVVTDALWRGSTDAGPVAVRVAVHAVRRVDGGTVLDWSLTPIDGPGLPDGRALGAAGPGAVGGAGERPAVSLVDVLRRDVYRPLLAAGTGCVCTSPDRIWPQLRVGRTTLLQVAFPRLDEHLATVDVDITGLPPFWNVPVTPIGQLPLPVGTSALGRPAEASGAALGVTGWERAGQRFVLQLDQITAARTFTALSWSVSALGAGPGLPAGPPVNDPDRVRGAPGGVADGPRLRADTVLRARLRSDRISGKDRLDCWCSPVQPPAALRGPGEPLHLVTVYPALPRGIGRVGVELPGSGGWSGVEVETAADGAFRTAGPVPYRARLWAGDPPPGWDHARWPTPVPAPQLLHAARPVLDTLVR